MNVAHLVSFSIAACFLTELNPFKHNRARSAAMNQQLYWGGQPAGAAEAAVLTLPNELLLLVWIELDDPAALSLTCKRLNSVSNDSMFQKRWLLARFMVSAGFDGRHRSWLIVDHTPYPKPYEVLFEAIARPRVCTADSINANFRPKEARKRY